MFRSSTLKIETENGRFVAVAITDGMKTVYFDTGIIELDYCIAFTFAKANYHVINLDQSIDLWLADNASHRWQTTKYGEFIVKVDIEGELT